jgi:hypothetical protein
MSDPRKFGVRINRRAGHHGTGYGSWLGVGADGRARYYVGECLSLRDARGSGLG